MTLKEFKELLNTYDENSQVLIYDYEYNNYCYLDDIKSTSKGIVFYPGDDVYGEE